jgi:putative transcription factor
MQCEMCGKVVEKGLVKAEVEGVVMNLCSGCASYGKIIKEKAKPAPARTTSRYTAPRGPEKVEFVDVHFGTMFKAKREQMKMRQKDMARFLNEKESLIHQLESGHIKPSQKLLEKLQSKIGMDFMREMEVKEYKQEKSNDKGFNLGDFIKK